MPDYNLAAPILTADWVTPNYISYHYHRSRRQVNKWCHDGTLIAFGFSVYHDASYSSRGRWWIKLPDTEAITPSLSSSTPSSSI